MNSTESVLGMVATEAAEATVAARAESRRRERQRVVEWLREAADQLEAGAIEAIDVNIIAPEPETRYLFEAGHHMVLASGCSWLTVRLGPRRGG